MKILLTIIGALFAGIVVNVSANPETTWDLEIDAPGTYQLEINHIFVQAPEKGARILYGLKTDEHTYRRPIYISTVRSNQPFRLFLTDIYRPQTVQVSISGMTASVPKQTEVRMVKRPARFEALWENNHTNTIERLKALLALPEDQINVAEVKLNIDQIVKPSIDIEASLNKIDDMVTEIKSMLPESPTASETLLALKRYLYESGEWNNYQPFQYNFDDPLGTNINHKLLPTYIESRKGNCVSMPFLFIALGERLGLDLNIATAPLHFFVKFNDPDTGSTYNLETTSGANLSRDSWYRQQMPMTDQAIQNGIYLRALNKQEMVAAMAKVVAEHYAEQGQYEIVIELSELLLQQNPRDAELLTKKGSAYYKLLEQHYIKRYPDPKLIPKNQQGYFRYLSDNNRFWFAKAESMGWRQPTSDYDEKYLQVVRKDAAKHKKF